MTFAVSSVSGGNPVQVTWRDGHLDGDPGLVELLKTNNAKPNGNLTVRGAGGVASGSAGTRRYRPVSLAGHQVQLAGPGVAQGDGQQPDPLAVEGDLLGVEALGDLWGAEPGFAS
jgi:hypothetical protein